MIDETYAAIKFGVKDLYTKRVLLIPMRAALWDVAPNPPIAVSVYNSSQTNYLHNPYLSLASRNILKVTSIKRNRLICVGWSTLPLTNQMILYPGLQSSMIQERHENDTLEYWRQKSYDLTRVCRPWQGLSQRRGSDECIEQGLTQSDRESLSHSDMNNWKVFIKIEHARMTWRSTNVEWSLVMYGGSDLVRAGDGH